MSICTLRSIIMFPQLELCTTTTPVAFPSFKKLLLMAIQMMAHVCKPIADRMHNVMKIQSINVQLIDHA